MGFKKVLATVLVATMCLGSAVSVNAATGSHEEPSKKTYIDKDSEDHTQTVVTCKVTSKGATVTNVAKKKTATKNAVTLEKARDEEGNVVAIVAIKTNAKFNKAIKKCIIQSKKRVTVNKKAFAKSSIQKVVLGGSKGKSAYFKAGSLKGSKVEKIYFRSLSAVKNLKVAKNVGKKVKVIVKKSVYNKLKKDSKALAAFTTKVKRLSGDTTIKTY
jgi:hypothetical protein